jgi:hypothetical protein
MQGALSLPDLTELSMFSRLNAEVPSSSSMLPQVNIDEDRIAASKREWEQRRASALARQSQPGSSIDTTH